MTGMEIVLLILGAVVVIVSFLIPEKREKLDDDALKAGEEQVRKIIDEQMKEAKVKLQDAADETLGYTMEKSERALERVSNEKITAVSEFSETVLQDIHKSHQEVMFLYDMLHDKQKNLRETVKEADRTSAIAKETKNELENAAKLYQEEMLQEPADMADKAAPADALEAALEPASAKEKASPQVSDTVSGASFEEQADASSGNNNEKILKLHKQGRSDVAIAKELGLGVGEVRLVIDLFEEISS